MRCQKLRSLLPAYCKRELEASVTSAMERHFNDCEGCREDLAAHRLIATSLSALADSSPNENHVDSPEEIASLFEYSELSESKETTNNKNTAQMPVFTRLTVSADFNNQLMERIANERFAETRAKAHTKAFLPQSAPRFAFRRLVPALVSVSAVAALAIVSWQQGAFNTTGNGVATQNSESNKANSFAFTPDDPILSAPALGKQLGLSEKYMTAQPIANPVYSSTATNSNTDPGSQSTATNLSLVSAQGARPISSPRQWQFAREYERACRIMRISNTLCRSGAYFKIVQFDANGVLVGPAEGIVFQCGPSSNPGMDNSPRIIVQPVRNAPIREQATQNRMVRGSF